MRGSIIRKSFEKVMNEYKTLSRNVKELKGLEFEEAIEVAAKSFQLSSMRDVYGEDFLYELFICMATVSALKNNLECGMQFHISDKSYMDLVDRPFHEMDKYTKEYLLSIDIPFKHLSITFEGENRDTDEGVYIIASRTEDGKGLLIYHFFENALIVRGYIMFDKLPRVYISCGTNSKKCDVYNEVILEEGGGSKTCMKTARNCDLCPLVNEDPMGIRRSIPIAKILTHSMLMIFEVMKRFNAPPEVISRIKKDIKLREDNPRKEHRPSDMIEIGKKRYRYMELGEPEEVGTVFKDRKSPCEHTRRGCTRTLRSGKVIQVKPSIVSKGKEKKIYKV